MEEVSEEPVFVEITSNCQPKQKQSYVSMQDNRLMLYYQGIKIYVPDKFNQNSLLSLLRTIKQL